MWIRWTREVFFMIIQEYKDGDTTIRIDNMYFPKSEEEREERYRFFNRVGCEILESLMDQE